jgi:hypothetical protein
MRIARECLLIGCLIGCQGAIERDAATGPVAPPEAADTVGTGTPPDTTPSMAQPDSAEPPAPAEVPVEEPTCEAEASFAHARIWQLTDEEYVNVVRDVFGIALAGDDANITTVRSRSGDYSNDSEGSQVDLATAQAYQLSAARLAPQIAATVECDGDEPDAACVESFVRDKVARAWRRPVTDEELEGLLHIFELALPDGAPRALHLVVEAALQSEPFLYRSEIGQDAADATAPIALTDHELASALSFLFTESAPDDALWEKAEAGTLTQPAVLRAEVDRLMALPVARANLAQKAAYWAGVERIPLTTKDPDLFPELTDELRDTLYQSAKLFMQDVIAEGTVSDLLSSKRIYANQALAEVYDIPDVTGDELVAVEVEGAARGSGILTQPGVMAATNHRATRADPIHRGLYLYRHFVCGTAIPAPPADALSTAATFPDDLSERELAGLRASMSCGGCHANFDPLGLATEQYDPIGRFDASVDASSVIAGLGADLDGPIADLAELGERLRSGRRVNDCIASYLAEYVLGHDPEAERSCAIEEVKDEFASSGSFADFFRALATSRAFLTRDPNIQ